MRVRHRDGSGLFQRLVVVFGDDLDSGFSEADARAAGADVLWLTGLAEWSAESGQQLGDLVETVREALAKCGLQAGQLICLGLSPHASGLALACGLSLGAANVICLGLNPEMWKTLVGSREADTRLVVLIAPRLDENQANGKWLASALERLPRCSVVEWRSPYDSTFAQVVTSAKPYWTALVTLLAHGADPRLGGRTVVGDLVQGDRGGQVGVEQWDNCESVCELLKASFTNGRLSVEGVAFFRGRPLPNYSDISHRLVLESESRRVVLPLGGVQNRSYSNRYARREWINYLTAGFADPRHAGLSLDNITSDRYFASVRISEYGRTEERPLDWTFAKTRNGCSGNQAFILHRDDRGQTVLDVVDIPRTDPDGAFVFRADQLRAQDAKLFVRGRLAVEGVPMREHRDGDFYLWLREATGRSLFFSLGTARTPVADIPFASPGDYPTANFADTGYNGVDVSSVPAGRYNLRIVLVTDSRTASVHLGCLEVKGDGSIVIDGKE